MGLTDRAEDLWAASAIMEGAVAGLPGYPTKSILA